MFHKVQNTNSQLPTQSLMYKMVFMIKMAALYKPFSNNTSN